VLGFLTGLYPVGFEGRIHYTVDPLGVARRVGVLVKPLALLIYSEKPPSNVRAAVGTAAAPVAVRAPTAATSAVAVATAATVRVATIVLFRATPVI